MYMYHQTFLANNASIIVKPEGGGGDPGYMWGI